MRIDLYTKTILTLIALLLAVIVSKNLISPSSSVQAQVSGVQYVGVMSGFIAIDSKSGDVWLHDFMNHGNKAEHLGKLVDITKPLVK